MDIETKNVVYNVIHDNEVVHYPKLQENKKPVKQVSFAK